jgi:hypothetical protein
MPVDPHIPVKPGSPQGTAQAIADLNRKVNKLMARSQLGQGSITHDVIATGTITAAEISAGVITALMVAGDVITAGGPSPASRIELTSSGFRSYNGVTPNLVILTSDGSVTTNGSLAVAGTTTLGGTLTVSGTATVSGTIQTNAASSRGVKITSGGITGYDSFGASKFTIDGTTGLITCTGVIIANANSQIPTGTVTGSMPGSANRYSNSSFQDMAGALVTTGWTYTGATAADGGTTVPVFYGSRTLQLTATAASVSVQPSTVADSFKRVVPTVGYTFSHWLYPVTHANSSRVDIAWYDNTGTLISTTTGAAQTTVLNAWNRVVQYAAAPANAAYAIGIHYVALSATTGDVTYIEGFQMEEGDRASSYSPRPDEILLASLSAISANLGSITAGTITSGTFQTSTSNPKTIMDSSGLYTTNALGVALIKVSHNDGLAVAALSSGGGQASQINFEKNGVGGTLLATITCSPRVSTSTDGYLNIGAQTQTFGGTYQGQSGITFHTDSVAGADTANNVVAVVTSADATSIYQATIIAGDGSSDFLKAANNLSDVANTSTTRSNIGLGSGNNVTFGNITATGTDLKVDVGSGTNGANLLLNGRSGGTLNQFSIAVNSNGGAVYNIPTTRQHNFQVGGASVLNITDTLLTLVDGTDIVIGTVTGTKIGGAGNQRIGFWGNLPLVQRTTTNITASGFTTNTGTAINTASTFAGYTLQQVVGALRQIGILA